MRFVSRIVQVSSRRAMPMALAILILTVLAGLFASRHFAMTTDATALISPKVAWRQDEMRLDRAFPQNGDLTLLVVDGQTPELAEAAATALTQELIADKSHFRTVRRPDGGDWFNREGLLFSSVADVRIATRQMIDAQPFLGPLAADPGLRGTATAFDTILTGVEQGAASLGQIDRPMGALADALGKTARGGQAWFSWQSLFSEGKGALAAPRRKLILVQPVLHYDDLMPGAASADQLRAIARRLNLDPAHGVTVRLTGPVPLSDEEFSSLADKAWLVATAMAAAMLITLWFATRSWKIVAAILATTVAGLVVTAAIGLAVIGRFNLISVAFIPLFVGLGVDFGIQLSVRFRAELFDHSDPAAALSRAAEGLGPSLVLAAGAVCLGFFAFLPTDYVGISELGVISGFGMIVALLLSVTLLPALLMLLRPDAPEHEVGSKSMAPVDRFLVERRGLVLTAFVVAMLATIASLHLVRFDFNPFHLRDAKGEAMATLIDLMHDPDRSPNTIDVLAPNADAARKLAARLAVLPEVSQAVTLDSFIPEDQPEKLVLIADARGLLDFTLDPIDVLPSPTDAQLVAALRELEPRLRKAAAAGGAGSANARRLADALAVLASGSSANRGWAQAMLAEPLKVMLEQMRMALDAQPVDRVTLTPGLRHDWVAADGRVRIQVFPKGDANDNDVSSRFVHAVRTIAPEASGAPVSSQEAARTIAHAFIIAGVLALTAVSLLLLAVLRSVREVAFTLAPVVLSGFLTLGSCVVIGQSINFANIIAFPLLFGVGVAFHIYFVMAWRAGATNLLQSSLARAVFFSAMATGLAFGSLLLSSHPGTASMGRILMISLAWTLVCALIFEPALLGPQPRKPDRR